MARLWPAIFLLLLLVSGDASLRAQENAPKRIPGVKGNACAQCHVALTPLPGDHAPTDDFGWAECKSCHSKESGTSLAGKLPLQHAHLLAGVGCAQCHADVNKPEAVPAKTCISCHETAKLAALTEMLEPTNPHESPHYGQDSDCNLCHHQHKKSTNDCAQCHNEYEFVVP